MKILEASILDVFFLIEEDFSELKSLSSVAAPILWRLRRFVLHFDRLSAPLKFEFSIRLRLFTTAFYVNADIVRSSTSTAFIFKVSNINMPNLILFLRLTKEKEVISFCNIALMDNDLFIVWKLKFIEKHMSLPFIVTGWRIIGIEY